MRAIIAFRGKSEFGKSKFFFTVFISSRVVINLLRDVIVDQSNRVPVLEVIVTYFLEARRELWETLGTMCSSTTFMIGVGVGICCEVFQSCTISWF